MEISKQVVSLDLSKKLKELGVKQESLWYWVKYDETNENYKDYIVKDWFLLPDCGETSCNGEDWAYIKEETYSAFTVAELGEMLPYKIPTSEFYLTIGKGKLEYFVYYVTQNNWQYYYNGISFHNKTEANARAKMLIYLLENKLMEI